MKKVVSIIALLVVIVALLGVNGLLVYNAISSRNQEVKNPVLSLEVEGYGNVKIELYPEYAPNTVKNIIALANNGYYNGKIFYGMDDIAVYVGRDANGESDNPTIGDIDKSVVKTEENAETNSAETNNTETAETPENTVEPINEDDYKYEIDGEFVANNFRKNTLKHEKGVVSLVRADYTKQMQSLTKESYNSGSSQFTIVMEDNNGLNGMYAGFGKVIEGMDIVEKIYGLEIKKEETTEESTTTTETTEESIKPFAAAPVIKTATVETYGVTYGLPKVHEAFDYSGYLQQLLNQYYNTSN
ncbi:MAG: peptidylprolyl isomerase [Clostridia bacterium]|nr:peptidylprolyl isomerase [Clostridia bacterium]